MTRKTHMPSLATYWDSVHVSIRGRVDAVKDYLRHPASGTNAEGFFRDLLRTYLPTRFAVESGFVVNTQGERSDLLDLLVVDCLNIPALSAESHFKVFPAEAVVAAIEVTSAPKSKVQRSGIEGKVGKLEDDLLKLAKLRNIAKHREYIFTIPSQVPTGVELREIGVAYSLSPRSFLLTCGDEWTKPDTYERNLMAALNSAATRHGDVWVNGVLSMRHGFFHFKPYTPFEHTRQSENALLEFITFLNNAIGEFPTSRINLARYRPTIPTASERPVAGQGDG